MKKITFSLQNVLEWCHSVLIFSCFYFIGAAILGFPFQKTMLFVSNSLWLFLPVIYSWILIRKARTLLMYLLCSIPCIFILHLFSQNNMTVVFGILLFGIRCYVRVIERRIKKMEKEMPGLHVPDSERNLWEIPTLLDCPRFPHLIPALICYLLLVAMNRDSSLFPLFCLMTLEFFLCFIHLYLTDMHDFIHEKRQIANLPVTTLKRTGNGLLIIFTILLLLFVAPSLFYGKEPLTNVQLPETLGNITFEEETEVMDSSDGGLELLLQNIEVRQTPEWVRKLFDALIYLLLIAVLLFAVKQALHILKNITENFSREEEDEIISLTPEKEEDSEALPFLPSFFRRKKRTPEHQIRHTYKKYILKHIKNAPQGFEAPSELEEAAHTHLMAHPDEFHSFYEKARYSQHTCTKEEAEHYRHLS